MDSVLARLQRALEGRTLVEHELGRGGMAVIYLGHDLRLDRRVAIKVFERDPGAAAATDRFLREIRIAAQLQHPNILPVFESGEAEGLVYYVMPYVAGGSLRNRLERESPLPIADAIRVTREVAEALDHAHRAGVVHRDIKPDNIMLADGTAVVADFGIARAIEQGGGSVTETGLAIGTPAYMSPEQATASKQLDGRTDIYSLGCVLYEMLTGSAPFQGATAQIVMMRHAGDSAPPVKTVRHVPDSLESVVQRALAKLPADRWPTGRAFADALGASVTSAANQPLPPRPMDRARRSAVVAVLIIAAGIWGWKATAGNGRVAGSTNADSIPSVAVLPLVLVGDSSQSHIAMGITEAVITAFIRVGGIDVPGQSTVSRFRSPDRDPVAIGRELGVAHVLDGTVQVEAPSLRLNLRMIRSRDGRVLWAQKLDANMKAGIFAVQDKITREIIDTLRVELAPEARQALARGVGTDNEEAYNDYMLGRAMYARADARSVRRAVEHFTSAARRDPRYAAPLAGLLDSWDLLANVEPGAITPPLDSVTAVINAGLKLDPTNGEFRGWQAIGRVRACDTSGADAAWREAVRLSPRSIEVRRNYAGFLAEQRDPAALVHITEAVALDRASPWVLSALAWTHLILGNLDSALAVSERSLALDTTQWVPNAVRGLAEAVAGREVDGIAHLEAARRLGGGTHSLTTAGLGWAYARAGRRDEALRIARFLEAEVRRGAATRRNVAMVYAGLGDTAMAFAWLAKPPRRTDWYVSDMGWPMFGSLASDPRFLALISRQACLKA